MKNTANSLVVVLISLSILNGCHLFSTSKAASIEAQGVKNSRTSLPAAQAAAAPVEVQALDTGRKTDVEIIWQVPTEQADSFEIKYGFDRERLDQRVEVKSEQLEKYTDPEYGQVYRFVLQDVSPDRDVYVAMSTIAGGQTSPPSTIYQAKAAGK